MVMAPPTPIPITTTIPTDVVISSRLRVPEVPAGELRIRAERIGERTAVVDVYRTAPFHLGVPNDRPGAGAAELIIQGVGPGYLPGDRLTTDITVGPGASLVVRGQGATKLYASPDGIPVTATASLTVEQGGRLVYLPGELIPFRHSILEQVTRIDVASGGSLAFGEIITSGRIAMGEVHQYTRLHLDVEIRYGGRLCLIERARLNPECHPLEAAGRHGPHAIAGTLYLIGEAHVLPQSPDIPDTVIWASAKGEGYALIRIFGATTQAVAHAMEALIPPA